MKFTIRIISILFLCSTLSTGQIARPGSVQIADSNHVLVDKLEFKYIITVFNDLNALRDINKQQVLKSGVLERIIADKDNLIFLKDEEIGLLTETIKKLSPAWYDKFLIGFGSAVAVIIGLLFVLK